jgi:hypothetical protein
MGVFALIIDEAEMIRENGASTRRIERYAEKCEEIYAFGTEIYIHIIPDVFLGAAEMWTFLTKDAWTREIKVKPWNRAYKDFEIEEEERRAARAADPLPPE